MSKATFIHTSDLQLGMGRWFLGDEQPVFDSSRLEAVRRLGEIAHEHGAQFIVMAGDVFDDNALSEKVVARALDEFARLPVPVYILPGNHDPLEQDNVLARTHTVDNVHVLDSTDPVEAADGVVVLGAPWKSKRPLGDLVVEAITDVEPSPEIRVVVGHGQVESRSGECSPGFIDLAAVERSITSGAVDYVALGDTHSTTSLGTTGKVWFSGSPETTDFAEPNGLGENDSGNVLVVTVDKDGERSTVQVQPVKTGEWVFDVVEATLNSSADVDGFVEKLDSYPDKRRTVIKYDLEGVLGLEDHRRLDAELARCRESFVNVFRRKHARELYVEPQPGEIEALELGGIAKKVMDELVATEDEDSMNAAHLLYRLAKEH